MIGLPVSFLAWNCQRFFYINFVKSMTSKASIFYQNSKKKLMKIDVLSLKIKLSQDLKFATFSFQKVISLKYLLQSSVSKNFSTKVTSLNYLL